MAHPRCRINVPALERTVLEQLIHLHSTPRRVAGRARMVLLADGEGVRNG
jgi:hypothetical protein